MPAISPERATVGAILLVTLTTVAGLTASGITQMVAADLFPLEPAPAHVNVAPTPAEAGDERESASAIARRVLSRNMFDPETGSLSWNPPAPPPSTDPSDSTTEDGIPPLPNGEPELCELPARLVAAMVIERKPELSFASIEENGNTMLYRAGMQVSDAQLVGIREQRVFLQPPSKPLCQVVMFKPEDVASPAKEEKEVEKKPRRKSRRKTRSGLTNEELEQGITKNSDTSYTVTRELVDKALGNQAQLMRSARIIPYEENGRTVGVKVYGIRRNSLLGRLGMQNGDVLRTINGFDMTSPDSALEAYTRLRSADNISVSMMRRGKPSTLEYSIR